MAVGQCVDGCPGRGVVLVPTTPQELFGPLGFVHLGFDAAYVQMSMECGLIRIRKLKLSKILSIAQCGCAHVEFPFS